MCSEVREQLNGFPQEQFRAHFLPWDQLSSDVQETKIRTAVELLATLDRAGYQVKRKKALAPQGAEV